MELEERLARVEAALGLKSESPPMDPVDEFIEMFARLAQDPATADDVAVFSRGDGRMIDLPTFLHDDDGWQKRDPQDRARRLEQHLESRRADIADYLRD